MALSVKILGCGSSSGVPAIGNFWGVCNPNNPKNRRLRSSILIKSEKTSLLFDATPDLRQQLLNSKVKHLDAILITHAHADHIHGLDDIRFLNVLMKSHLNLYATGQVIMDIKKRFEYVFEDLSPKANGFYYKPCLIPNTIKNSFKINELEIDFFEQDHGFSKSTGFRVNNVGYSTDVINLNENAFEKLRGIELWIVDCLRVKPHSTHSHLEKTLKWIEKLKPKKAILTHMNTDTDYDEISKLLPKGCEAGYDGLEVLI